MRSWTTIKKLDFSKYVATGNDFVVVEGEFDPRQVASLCQRRYGVGADGLLWICPSSVADVKMVYYNQDGSRASMCLNGLRVVFFHSKATCVETDMGVYEGSGTRIELPMWQLVEGQKVVEGVVGDHFHTGVDHFVVEGLEHFSKAARMRELVGANVNCYEEVSDGVRVRTFERGVEGETHSCGTGAYACFAKLEKDQLKVQYCSGAELYFSRENGKIWMEGDVKRVFAGEI